MRLSFGGGGTEIPPYVDEFGGSTLSTSIAIYARVSLELNGKNEINLFADDAEKSYSLEITKLADIDFQSLDKSIRLAFACTNYLINKYKVENFAGFNLRTTSDAPQGSGLGASSVLTVAIIKALEEVFELHLSKSQIASDAYYIEREYLKLSGGKQDHYAATFGGCNYIQYHANGIVSVEPVEITVNMRRELESSLICIYTGTSRESAHIIENQQESMRNKEQQSMNALHEIGALASKMRSCFRNEDVPKLGKLLSESWELKKSTSPLVSNSSIDELYGKAIDLGAYGGKIAGAGGGGFLMLLAPVENRLRILRALRHDGSIEIPITLTQTGVESWKVLS